MDYSSQHHRSLLWIQTLFRGTDMPDPVHLLGEKYAGVIDKLLGKPRSGWLKRGIPVEQAETVAGHSAKVAVATALYVRSSVNKCIPPHVHDRAILTAGLHDLAEWNCPDYTPEDIRSGRITAEEKRRAEFASLRAFADDHDGDALPEQLFYELECRPELATSQIIHQIDKLDAAIMALNYRRSWFPVEEFIPYAQSRVHDPLLYSALTWLASLSTEKDYFYLYALYLHFSGDTNQVMLSLQSNWGYNPL